MKVYLFPFSKASLTQRTYFPLEQTLSLNSSLTLRRDSYIIEIFSAGVVSLLKEGNTYNLEFSPLRCIYYPEYMRGTYIFCDFELKLGSILIIELT